MTYETLMEVWGSKWETHIKSSELSSLGAKLTTDSLSIFKSAMIRLVILTLFSKIALRKISYSFTNRS